MAEDSNWGENTLKQRAAIEWNKFKALSGKEKFRYFKAYYMWKTIALFVVIVMTVVFVKNIFFDRKDTIISGALLNAETGKECAELLADGFNEYVGAGSRETAKISAPYYVAVDNELDYNNKMLFSTMIQGNVFDYIITGKEDIEYLLSLHACGNLANVLDEKFLSDNEDRIYYVEEEGQKIPIAISLAGTKLYTDYELIPKDCYLVFTFESEHKDKAQQFVDYYFSR